MISLSESIHLHEPHDEGAGRRMPSSRLGHPGRLYYEVLPISSPGPVIMFHDQDGEGDAMLKERIRCVAGAYPPVRQMKLSNVGKGKKDCRRLPGKDGVEKVVDRVPSTRKKAMGDTKRVSQHSAQRSARALIFANGTSSFAPGQTSR